jgi:hypothetical protein
MGGEGSQNMPGERDLSAKKRKDRGECRLRTSDCGLARNREEICEFHPLCLAFELAAARSEILINTRRRNLTGRRSNVR